jgi:hypothetical protein
MKLWEGFARVTQGEERDTGPSGKRTKAYEIESLEDAGPGHARIETRSKDTAGMYGPE